MSGFFELQVKDRIYISHPPTPGLIITAGAQKFIARFKRLVLVRGSANEEMWSKQQTLGMYFDMLRHTNNYRDIVGRWTPAAGEGVKMGTGQRLYLAFAIPRRPNIDELALLAGFDHEAGIRKAISVVLEIDRIMDLNIDNLRRDPLDRYWPYQCCGNVCICFHHPGDDRADGALSRLYPGNSAC